MSEEELNYAISKIVPDMHRRGCTISTCYGDIVVQADEVQPFAKALSKLIEKRLKQFERDYE